MSILEKQVDALMRLCTAERKVTGPESGKRYCECWKVESWDRPIRIRNI